jgi:ATP:ADP antiporter, AAA family
MKSWIERALNVRPGDLGRGSLLCACLFLVMTSYKVGGVAGNALFLSRFRAWQLAYADISSAVLVAMVIAGYVLIARRVILRDLLVLSMVFFAATWMLFWGLAHYYSRVFWVFPAFYVWVKIFGVLGATQIWTLANYVLTTREAKRVFGMVGGGGIAGWIFSGFLAKTMAKRFGTESLLLAMTVFVLICAGLVILVWRSGRELARDTQGTAGGSNETASRSLTAGLQLLVASPYLRAIAAVIWVSSLVTTLTGWQFSAIGQQYFVSNKDAMAVFFGDFNFYAGILGLLFQLLLTARFLRRFGIGTALFVLPVIVFLGSAGVLVFGTLGAVVALKGCDQVLRYSVDRSTAELLFLPIPARVKLQVKWFIDTVIWRLGDGLSGVTVLIFVALLHFSPRQISWIVLVLVSGWLVAVSVAQRQYVATLRESISQHRLDVEQASAPVLDRSTTDLMATNLSASDPKDILYALSLFEVEQQTAAHPGIRALLSHPAPEVRQKAIALLSAAGDKAAFPDVQRLLRDPELSVRTEALLFLSHHGHIDPLTAIEQLGDFPDFSVRSAVVAFLAQPGEAQNLEAARNILCSMVDEAGEEGLRNRVEAARLLGELPDCFDPLLSRLLADSDTHVACEAIHSVGMLRKRRLVPELLDRLADPRLAPAAAQALGRFGDSIVGGLRDHLCDSAVPIQARREIPSVLVALGTPAAASVLLENLLQSDTKLRYRTIAALNKLCQVNPQIVLDAQMLETVLAAEILGHYRSYQILATIGAATDGADPLARALKESMQQELERIFRLLNLLHPHLDLHSAYVGLQSTSVSVHDNALEFLDNVLKSHLREMLVPLLDSKITVAERAQIAHRLVRTKIESQEQAVAELVASEDPWLKSCGAYAIGTLGIKSLEGQLDRCLNESDPLLRETARAAKLRLEALAAKS